MLPDYYFVLGIPFNADLQAIKTAYRSKAIIAHPDRGGSHEAMLRINEAYEILANPNTRQHYDEARGNQYNQGAQQQARADTSKAQQQAQQYPRQWTDFESWLTRDFTEAEYGEWGMFPTVSKSGSGILFILIGLVAGGIGSVALFETGVLPRGETTVKALIFITIIGGVAGQGIHKWIGKSMCKPDAPPKPPTPSHNTPTPPANPLKAETTAHDKGVGLAVIVGIIAFIILCCVYQETTGGGLFAPPDISINWPGVFIGTGVCTFIAYHAGKKL